ncbi:hypothetical protein C8F04DRAFT_1368550 [Mycena alexandri]|uniref:Spherulin-4 n=1 Tax=Mycena alexandri TaxID=1745969 RepID=A0AAD6SP75_9AGAR|nr:hypothetical protein C8F04DRAFT_1368550 [Mycena alexandri]
MILDILLSVLAFLTCCNTFPPIPLYSYPETNATWEPLEMTIKTFPDVQFYVIVNPRVGPALPTRKCQAAVAAFHAYARAACRLRAYELRFAAAGPSAAGHRDTQAGLTHTYTAYADAARNATWPGRTTDIVTFENTLPLAHPAQQAVIMNSFNGTNETLASVVQAFETLGLASADITDLDRDSDIYKSFGSDWTVFVQDVNTERGSGISRCESPSLSMK